jgi:hypothetical protein
VTSSARRVLLDQQHSEPVGVELRQHREDLGDDGGRETEGRLVEQQQARPAHERAADGQHLLLAARKIARVLMPPLGKDREQCEHPRQILLGHAPAAARGAVAEAEVLLDRERAEDATALGHHDHAAARHRVSGTSHEARAVEADLALGGAHQAADRFQQRRLAGAVGADDRHRLALCNGERNLVHRDDAAVARRQAGDREPAH